MESIEKLRELAMEIISHTRLTPPYLLDGDWLDSWHRAFDKACDDIEREIEDKIDDLMATSVDGYPEPFNTPDAMHMVLGTAADCFDTPQEAVHYLRGETSMLLPVDADGVPIRVGDKMEREGQQFIVCAVAPAVIHSWAAGRKLGEGLTTVGYRPEDCRHVKPRTIEDVLREFASKQHGITTEENDALIAEYADELREMGVCDD